MWRFTPWSSPFVYRKAGVVYCLVHALGYSCSLLTCSNPNSSCSSVPVSFCHSALQSYTTKHIAHTLKCVELLENQPLQKGETCTERTRFTLDSMFFFCSSTAWHRKLFGCIRFSRTRCWRQVLQCSFLHTVRVTWWNKRLGISLQRDNLSKLIWPKYTILTNCGYFCASFSILKMSYCRLSAGILLFPKGEGDSSSSR